MPPLVRGDVVEVDPGVPVLEVLLRGRQVHPQFGPEHVTPAGDHGRREGEVLDVVGGHGRGSGDVGGGCNEV